MNVNLSQQASLSSGMYSKYFSTAHIISCTQNTHSTTTEAVNAAGFAVTVDGSPGHRSIAIKEGQTIPEADLRGKLQAIVWEGPTPRKADVVNNLESESNDATQSTDGEN